MLTAKLPMSYNWCTAHFRVALADNCLTIALYEIGLRIVTINEKLLCSWYHRSIFAYVIIILMKFLLWYWLLNFNLNVIIALSIWFTQRCMSPELVLEINIEIWYHCLLMCYKASVLDQTCRSYCLLLTHLVLSHHCQIFFICGDGEGKGWGWGLKGIVSYGGGSCKVNSVN